MTTQTIMPNQIGSISAARISGVKIGMQIRTIATQSRMKPSRKITPSIRIVSWVFDGLKVARNSRIRSLPPLTRKILENMTPPITANMTIALILIERVNTSANTAPDMRP